MRNVSLRTLAFTGLLVILCATGFTQVVKQGDSYLDTLAYKDFDLGTRTQPVALGECINTLPNRADWNGFLARFPQAEVHIDRYTGMPALVNGTRLPWVTGNPFSPTQRTLLVNKARQFITENAGVFRGLPLDNLSLNLDRSGPFGEDGYLWFLDFDFVHQGVPIDGARVVFRCNHGNMVQFGVEGLIPLGGGLIDRILNPIPAITADHALDIAFGYAGGFDDRTDTIINPGTLKFMPRLTDPDGAAVASRFAYPLVWEVAFIKQGVTGSWKVWVDAHTGQVLSFFDDNAYGIVKGGVYPVSQTASTEVVRGLPFANVASGVYANWAGRYDSPTSGTVTSTLAGKYVKISDACGSISLAATAPADLNFSSSSGTDCTTPGVGGAGNTHAARSCFYHVGNLKYKAMQWLPSNTWLQGQLTANVNKSQTCNAYWNGSTINFFKSGGGCGNTGEIAHIFLHEFAHGLDSNDGGPSSDMSSGESYADGLAMMGTHSSCGGPGFLSSNCTGYGDACTSCTGVRDFDYAKHSSGSPHTIAQTMGTTGFKCPTSSSYYGPCGREGHCESYPGSEVIWDLAVRDIGPLRGDTATGWFVLERLFFLSRATSGSMYTCDKTNKVGASCSSSNWLQTFLVVDDNDGNLSNGTPHGAAIKAAFTRHGMTCSSTVGTNYGCSNPSAPSVTATAGNNSVGLSWSAVSGATKYLILRNDLGCDYGYIKIAETTSTSYTDSQVYNGMTYYYRVIAGTGTASCFSNLSACKTVTPTSGGTTTYSISGTVTNGGGATVALTGAATANTTADASGNYGFSGLANGSYTVTPSKTGCTFSPTSIAVSISGADQTGKNFTATCPTGDVALTSGIGYNDSVLKSAWKYYTIAVPSGATNLEIKTTNASGDVDLYTQVNAKPTSSSYVCRPYSSSGNETCTQANPTTGTWYAGVYGYAAGSYTITATVTTATATYSISGTITNGAGATVNLTGTAAATATADASGNYSFAGLSNGSYTVTPSKSGCTFSPTSIAVSISGANQTGKNFTATCGSSDTQLSNGVAVTGQSVAQGAWKYYYITVPSGATSLELKTTSASADVDIYTQLTNKPTSSSYVCRPYTSSGNETCTQTNPTAGTWWLGVYGYAAGSYTVTGTYVLGGTTYSISGTVSGATASGVTMTLAGAGTGTQTTSTTGTYTFSGLVNGSYTVTPSKAGYTFSPTSLAVTISGANQTGKNFTSTASSSCNAVAATYNTTYKAPACLSTGKSCTTGTTLVKCAGTGESNYPNTVNASCADGTSLTSGTCSSDESVSQIIIATTDGSSCLASGKQVTVTATFYCYGTSDRLSIYYATSLPSSGAPTWTIQGAVATCAASGVQTLSRTFNLSGSSGAMQAVRAQITYNASPTNACYTGTWNDRDDLVFKLQ